MEPIYINGARRVLSQLSVVSIRTMLGGGGDCGFIYMYITQTNLNSSAQQNRFNKSHIQAKIQLCFIAFCKGSTRVFWFQRHTRGLCSIPFQNFDDRLSWRSNSIPLFLIKPFNKEKEMKILSTYLPLSL